MGTLGRLVRLFSALSRSTRVTDRPKVQTPGHFVWPLLRAYERFSAQTGDAAPEREPLFDDRDVRTILFWTFAGGWTALLLALRVGVVEAYTVPCAVILIASGLHQRRAFSAEHVGQVTYQPVPGSPVTFPTGLVPGVIVLRAGLVLAFAPSVILALFGAPAWARFVFLIAGGLACARIGRQDARLAGGVALSVGVLVGVLRAVGLPAGLVAEVAGVLAGLAWLAFGPKPAWHGSWRTLGGPLALTFAPPLIASFVADPSWVRRLFLIAGGVLTVVIGLRRQLRAPVVVGAVVLATAVAITIWR